MQTRKRDTIHFSAMLLDYDITRCSFVYLFIRCAGGIHRSYITGRALFCPAVTLGHTLTPSRQGSLLEDVADLKNLI